MIIACHSHFLVICLNFFGCFVFLATQLRAKYPHIIIVHCFAHRLGLPYKDAMKLVTTYIKLQTLVQGIFAFYKGSPNSHKALTETFKINFLLYVIILDLEPDPLLLTCLRLWFRRNIEESDIIRYIYWPFIVLFNLFEWMYWCFKKYIFDMHRNCQRFLILKFGPTDSLPIRHTLVRPAWLNVRQDFSDLQNTWQIWNVLQVWLNKKKTFLETLR